MGFKLVPKSVTLDDLELRYSHAVCVISLNSVAFMVHCAKVVEDTPTLCHYAVQGHSRSPNTTSAKLTEKCE